MALNNLGLGFVFTAKDLATGAIERVRDSFMDMEGRTAEATSAFRSNFAQFGQGLAILGAGLGVIEGAFALAGAAGEFEQALAGVAAVSGATAQELQALKGAAIEAGVATQFSPSEATLGLRELSQAGFSARESITLLIPVLDLAAGSLGELTPQGAAGLAAQAMKAFGIEARGAGVAVDQILQAVNVFALSAGELPLALGTASRGAQALHQSLSETLVALGLVKNVIPSVERASTAAAVAMEQLADPQVQQKLRAIGVSAVNSAGQFRPFLDVMGELAPALEAMSEAKRSAFLLDVFGREALAGVNAILTQVNQGIRTHTGETLRGGAALAYLRGQFEAAGGTAARFRERLLDTLEGQQTLLRGSLQTLAIVVGEPLAAAFKPLVWAITAGVNRIIQLMRAVPSPVKKALAQVAVGVGVVATAFGAFVAAKTGVVLLAAGLKAVGITVVSVAAALGPLLLVFAALALVAKGFAVAFEKDIGGIGSFVERAAAGVRLLSSGLQQLFEGGGFSGALMEELAKAEHQGVKQFAIRVFQVAFRVQRFFGGIAEGFRGAIESARPVLNAFTSALTELGRAFGLVGTGAADAAAGMPSDKFAAAGKVIGSALGVVVSILTEGFTLAVQVATGVVHALRTAWLFLTPAVNVISKLLSGLSSQVLEAVRRLGFLTGASQGLGGVFRVLGTVLGAVVGLVGALAGVLVGILGTALHIVVAAVRAVVEVFRGLAELVEGVVFIIGGIVTGDWTAVWLGFKKVAFSVFNALIGVVAAFMEAVSAVVDTVAGLFGADLGAAEAVRRARVQIEQGLGVGFGVVEAATPAPSPSVVREPSASLVASMPAAAQAATQAEAAERTATTLASRPPPEPAPTHVNLIVDGEVLARATARAERSAAARSFSPVPVQE